MDAAAFVQEVEASAPRFLVFVDVRSSWQRNPESRTELFDWLDGYVRKYRLVGRMTIDGDAACELELGILSQATSCVESCNEVFERMPAR